MSRLVRISGSDCPVVSKDRLDTTVAEFEGMATGPLRRMSIRGFYADASAREADFRALSAVADRRQLGAECGGWPSLAVRLLAGNSKGLERSESVDAPTGTRPPWFH